MRVPRSSSAATLLAWLVPLVSSISVPTGKLTPITPAKPVPRTVNPQAPSEPAPVVEYSQDRPEPPPLDPSYVPYQYNYFDTLSRHHIVYVPTRFRNFNAISNEISYEPLQKYQPGLTLGKNFGYKSYKQAYLPASAKWANQQYKQPSYPYNNVDSNQYNNVDNSQYNNVDSNQYNSQYNHQYQVQPTQQQQQEAASTVAPPSSTEAPSSTPAPSTTPSAPHKDYRKVDYSTGKGSYDITGKGGSKSEFYSQDWSKKTSYPKKVPSQSLTHRKYYSHKY